MAIGAYFPVDYAGGPWLMAGMINLTLGLWTRYRRGIMRSIRLSLGVAILMGLAGAPQEALGAAATPVAVDLPTTATFQQDVFTSGTDGYAIYRIPALISTSSGTLLSFAEGRRHGGSDTGAIDIVLRRSGDGGRTWGELQVVCRDGANTCGNPAPVVDAATGRIILLSTWNLGSDTEKQIEHGTSSDTRRVYVCHSDDDGVTWTDRREITADTKEPGWTWYATGPGHGIQMRDGRLVIPANHSRQENRRSVSYSHVIASTDGGETWTLGGSTGRATNESTVAPLNDGRLMLNSRSNHGVNRRAVSWSSDGGASWYGPFLDPALVEPVCEGSLLSLPTAEKGRAVLLFSNPAFKKRERLTVRLSRDDGQTWSAGLVLEPGVAAYSDLAMINATAAGCLYEAAGDTGKLYGRIVFARMDLR